MWSCTTCGAARRPEMDFCHRCRARYEQAHGPARWWQATATRPGLVGRAVWALVILIALWPLLSMLGALGMTPQHKLMGGTLILGLVLNGKLLWPST
jgi:hypothetical protein